MAEEVLNLLKLLAEDDNFAFDFEKAKSIEEKYDLAKSKFEGLQKDDFIKFMQEFQEEQSEISEKELSHVSGGLNKKSLVTKLTALAMLATTFGSISSASHVMASDPHDDEADESLPTSWLSRNVRPRKPRKPRRPIEKKEVKTPEEIEAEKVKKMVAKRHELSDSLDTIAKQKFLLDSFEGLAINGYKLDKAGAKHILVGSFDPVTGLIQGAHFFKASRLYQDNEEAADIHFKENHKAFGEKVLTYVNYRSFFEDVLKEIPKDFGTLKTEVEGDTTKTFSKDKDDIFNFKMQMDEDGKFGRFAFDFESETAHCTVRVVVNATTGNIITMYPVSNQ